MPNLGKDLRLPDSPESIAFRAIVGIFESDPTLKSTVKTMWSWKGEANDTILPSQQHCPFLRLTPNGSQMAWETEDLHNQTLQIVIEVGVEGTQVDQAMRLWHAVKKALFPDDLAAAQANRLKIVQAKIVKPTFRRPTYTPQTDPTSSLPFLIGSGVLDILIHVNT